MVLGGAAGFVLGGPGERGDADMSDRSARPSGSPGKPPSENGGGSVLSVEAWERSILADIASASAALGGVGRNQPPSLPVGFPAGSELEDTATLGPGITDIDRVISPVVVAELEGTSLLSPVRRHERRDDAPMPPAPRSASSPSRPSDGGSTPTDWRSRSAEAESGWRSALAGAECSPARQGSLQTLLASM